MVCNKTLLHTITQCVKVHDGGAPDEQPEVGRCGRRNLLRMNLNSLVIVKAGSLKRRCQRWIASTEQTHKGNLSPDRVLQVSRKRTALVKSRENSIFNNKKCLEGTVRHHNHSPPHPGGLG
jgi:hypothetical protein